MKKLWFERNGKKLICTVDDEDFEWVSKLPWNWNGWRVSRVVYSPRKKTLLLHREILGYSGKKHVDHIDGNPLNNQRTNLRVVTRRQNAINCKRYATNTSGVQGVTFKKKDKRWIARISTPSGRIHLGSSLKKEEAVAMRKRAEKKYYGIYARNSGII